MRVCRKFINDCRLKYFENRVIICGRYEQEFAALFFMTHSVHSVAR